MGNRFGGPVDIQEQTNAEIEAGRRRVINATWEENGGVGMWLYGGRAASSLAPTLTGRMNGPTEGALYWAGHRLPKLRPGYAADIRDGDRQILLWASYPVKINDKPMVFPIDDTDNSVAGAIAQIQLVAGV